MLWRDGSKTGSTITPNTVWYQGEDFDQSANEDSNIKAESSQSIWYDGDTVDQRETEQLEQKECDLSSAQASGLSTQQLLEQGLSSHQLSAALSQPHAVGTQPVLSHGPGAQRREVHRSQQEEEVVADWKEGGREEASKRETTRTRKSSGTVEIEEGGEEKPESEETGAKGRKKRRKKRGKRGGAEVKLNSSSSIESQSQIEVESQRELVTNLNPQSDTTSEAKDITGRADVQSPRTPEPTRREEADKDAMHLPSQAEGENTTAHGSDCVTNPESSYTSPGLSSTELERIELTDAPASQELSEESMNFHGLDDLNPDSKFTASELNETNARKIEILETVHSVRTELLNPAHMEVKGLTSPLQQTVDNVQLLTETEDFSVAGEAVSSKKGTGLVESNSPAELPVKHSDPKEFTEDSFLMEFPEQKTQHVQPVDLKGKPPECMESEPPTEAVGQIHLVGAHSLPFEGTADVSPLQIQEGSAETTAGEYLEHCLASKMLRDQQHMEEKKNHLWSVDEEMSKDRKKKNEMAHPRQTVEDEFPLVDREREQHKYNEDLVSTAVAVVAVAIASAVASIEMSQQLADNQTELQETASKAEANDPPLAPEASTPADADDTLNSIKSTQLFAQLLNKDNDNYQLLTDSHTAQTVNQHVLIKPIVHFSSKEPTDAEPHSIKLQSQNLQAAQPDSDEHANPDLSTTAHTPSVPHHDNQETEATKNKLLKCSLPKEDGLLTVNIESYLEANETIITKIDSQGHMPTEIQLQQESPPLCPVIDTGQHPQACALYCPHSEDNPKLEEGGGPQDQSICGKESEIRAKSELESHLEKNEGCDEKERSAEDGEGVQVQQDSSDTKSERSESEGGKNTGMQAERCRGNQHVDGQVQTPSEGEIPTLPLSTLPVIPSDSAPVAGCSLERLTVNLETGEFQSPHSLPDMKPDTGNGTLRCDDSKSVVMDNKDGVFTDLDKDSDTLDTVDGWKERQKNKMHRQEEAKKEMAAADTSQTGK